MSYVPSADGKAEVCEREADEHSREKAGGKEIVSDVKRTESKAMKGGGVAIFYVIGKLEVTQDGIEADDDGDGGVAFMVLEEFEVAQGAAEAGDAVEASPSLLLWERSRWRRAWQCRSADRPAVVYREQLSEWGG